MIDRLKWRPVTQVLVLPPTRHDRPFLVWRYDRFARSTQALMPETDQLLLLAQLGWRQPAQASPRISAKNTTSM